jgi:ATP-dependent Clp protease ATP-binding subunit ClpC
VFNPEFLNRIDDVLTFKPLEREHIFKIIDILSEDLFKRIKEIGYDLELTKGAKEFITDQGFDQKYGARPLKRALQKYVEDPLAEEILGVEHGEGSLIKIKMNKSRDGLEFDWTEVEKDSKKSSDSSSDEDESKSESKEEQTKA